MDAVSSLSRQGTSEAPPVDDGAALKNKLNFEKDLESGDLKGTFSRLESQLACQDTRQHNSYLSAVNMQGWHRKWQSDLDSSRPRYALDSWRGQQTAKPKAHGVADRQWAANGAAENQWRSRQTETHDLGINNNENESEVNYISYAIKIQHRSCG